MSKRAYCVAMVPCLLTCVSLLASPQSRVPFGPHQIWPTIAGLAQPVVVAPDEVVRGFPLLLDARVTNTAAHSTGLSVLDLARGGTGETMVFYLWDGADGAYWMRIHQNEELRVPGRPTTSAQPGETVSMWFDLVNVMHRRHGGGPFHSMFPRGSPKGWPGPREMLVVGSWQLVVQHDPCSWTSSPVTLTVRDPDEQERHFLDQIDQMGVIDPRHPTWFPDLVFTPKALPAADGLPASTRRIVELVELLRAAVRSSEEGLRAITAKSEFDWGYLQDLVNQVEYECLLEAPDEVKVKHPELELFEPDRKRINDGGGIVAQLRALRQ